MARRAFRWLNPGIVAGAMVPVAALAWRAATGRLGANPIEEALNAFGLLALVLLVSSLVCTPLRRITGWTWPARVRRTLGLLAFAFAVLHVLVYAGLDQGFRLSAIGEDVLERRFIFVGFAAFLLMAPLALTSTSASVRRLGYARWERLHRLVYVAAVLAVVHFVWRVKADLGEPLVYAAILSALLLFRVVGAARRGAASPP
jgi:sulfoxide reductase heme-binding subunit YedZ